jgi:hypothetical protein
MKSSFAGFYTPTDKEFIDIWKNCTFVLDTNVILNLYRYPSVAREEFFGVLERIKDRLWIPHQVGLEYQRRRLTVIAGERKKMDDSLIGVTKAIDEIKDQINSLEISKRGLDISTDDITEYINSADNKLLEVMRRVNEAQLDISTTDPIRERIDLLLNGRVGPCPANAAELETLVFDGENRYPNKIPPGFKDIDKDKDPNNSHYYFNGLKYTAKYGDLILWRQLIDYVKNSEIKKILFITSDRKEDWWWIEKGRTLGPHPELVREIIRLAEVDFFWMYSAEQFIENANKHLQTNVSAQTLIEVKNTSSSESELSESIELLDTAVDEKSSDFFRMLGNVPSASRTRELLRVIKEFHSNKSHPMTVGRNYIIISDNGKADIYFIKRVLFVNSESLALKSSEISNVKKIIRNFYSDDQISLNLIIIIPSSAATENPMFVRNLQSVIDVELVDADTDINKVITGFYHSDGFKVVQVSSFN